MKEYFVGMDYMDALWRLEKRFGLSRHVWGTEFKPTVGELFDCVWQEIRRREEGMPEDEKSPEEEVWLEVCRIILAACGNTMDVGLMKREMKLVEDLGVD